MKCFQSLALFRRSLEPEMNPTKHCAAGVWIVLLLLLVPAQLLPAQSRRSSVRAAPSASPAAAAAAASQAKASSDNKNPSKPGESKEKGKEDGKEKEKSDGEPKTVKRSATPPETANPEELKLRPDKEGRLQFNFSGQLWTDVLEWLAGVSAMSLDWQEVPEGYVNLKTQDSYTVDEARDMINSLLLARGFTLLRHGEVLSVVNLKKLNPASVPRVTPEELTDREPHEFVKVSFPTGSLLAEEAQKELKEMLSGHGKLTALKMTNRLEAVDAVVNLQQIYSVLKQEQTDDGEQGLVSIFHLQYTRAADVRAQLLELLGIEEKQPATAPNSQSMQLTAQIAQLKSQLAQKGIKQPTKVKIFLLADERKNTILANAPPDIIAKISKAVDLIDVPSERTSLLRSLRMHAVKVYRLHGIDPQTLVQTLHKRADLDPKTQLDVDIKNNAVIAFASPVDHLTIQRLVDTLDGSGRSFEAIPLKRLEADYVAGTIEFMMVGEDEKPQGGGGYTYISRYIAPDRSSQDKFRVDADVENNKLLLWANEVELREVWVLLEKLGEVPPRGGNPDTIRVIDAAPGEATERLLEQIRRAWQGPNKLNLPPRQETEEPTNNPAAKRQPAPAEPSRDTRTEVSPVGPASSPLEASRRGVGHSVRGDQQKSASSGAIAYLQLAQFEQPVDKSPVPRTDDDLGEVPNNDANEALPKAEQPPGALFGRQEQSRKSGPPPPITINIGPDGRLVVSSDDTRALDQLEELLMHLAPPRKDYEIFPLKFAYSLTVSWNLEDFFKEEEEKKENVPYWYRSYRQQNKKERSRLSRRPPLRFISDEQTNSVLVQGADPRQLAKIRDLIAFWDKPQPTDSQLIRKFEFFQLKYSKAEIIADAVKEVFRDLLSENDKALIKSKEAEQKPGKVEIYDWGYSEDDEPEQKVPKFKGYLSIGVDSVSNSLMVSAPDLVLRHVTKMIEQLDLAARPTVKTIQVMQVGRGINSDALREKLANVLADSKLVVDKADEEGGEKSNRGSDGSNGSGSNGGSR